MISRLLPLAALLCLPTFSASAQTLANAPALSTEPAVDHVLLIKSLNNEALKRGEALYTSHCVPCHGTPEQEGYLSLSRAFWKEPFKNGGDLFGMYQTLTHGLGLMPPWPTLTPVQKYDVSHYVREILVKPNNPAAYAPVTDAYLAKLPKPRG